MLIVEDSNRDSAENRKSNYNSALWERVQKFSKGDICEKIEALSIILKQRDQLPAESIKIAFAFADKEQPKEVRLAVAKGFGKLHLSTKQYFSFLEILANDQDNDVRWRSTEN